MWPLKIINFYHRLLVAMALSVSGTLAVAQGTGSWGGAGGIVQFVLIVAGVFYLLGVWLIWLLAKVIGLRGSFRSLLTIVIACSPLAYCEFKSQRMQAGIEAQDQTFKDLMIKVHAKED